MSILQQQETQGALSGAMKFVSNVNNFDVLIIDENRGAYTNPKKYVRLFDDFLGDVIADQWSAAEGNDAQAIIATINADVNGVVRMTTGDTTTVSESAQSLTHALNWKANQGGLYMGCRFKPVTSVADVAYFVGFTDVLATTTLEEPITLSGTTLTTNATDAVGFVFDTAATNDTWHCQGVANGTDTALTNSTIAPTADTYQDLEIFVDTSGGATFYINGALVATVAACVTATVALTPAVVAMARTTTSKSVDIDWIDVRAKRT